MNESDGVDLGPDEKRFLRRYVPISAFIGGLCCFTPVVTVLLGLGSVSYAASLTDLLYDQYAWAFRLAALAFLLAALGVYLYRIHVRDRLLPLFYVVDLSR